MGELLNNEIDNLYDAGEVTIGNVLGCAGIAFATIGPPLMAVFGKGNVRKAGIALTIAEVAVAGLGLEVSGFN